MTVYLFCYDITEPKRLRKVAKKLEKYGIRLQKSFFQIRGTKENKEKIKKDLLTQLDLKKDRLNIYTICEACYRKVDIQGAGILLRTEDFLIL